MQQAVRRPEELNNLKEKALKQFKGGKSLFGKDGAFAPLLKEFLQEALEAEMQEHLADPEKGSQSGNKRNGKGSKTLKSTSGEFTIQTPQDRHSNFEPEIVKKRQRILADNIRGENYRSLRAWYELEGYILPYQGNV